MHLKPYLPSYIQQTGTVKQSAQMRQHGTTTLDTYASPSTWDRLQYKQYIDGLLQEKRNSSALAMELRLSCTKPSIHRYHALLYDGMICVCVIMWTPLTHWHLGNLNEILDL